MSTYGTINFVSKYIFRIRISCFITSLCTLQGYIKVILFQYICTDLTTLISLISLTLWFSTVIPKLCLYNTQFSAFQHVESAPENVPFIPFYGSLWGYSPHLSIAVASNTDYCCGSYMFIFAYCLHLVYFNSNPLCNVSPESPWSCQFLFQHRNTVLLVLCSFITPRRFSVKKIVICA